MSNKKNIIWLASYPKSGNTWLRIFLTNYFSNSEYPADINNLDNITIYSSRSIFDEYSPFSSSDLNDSEITKLRYEVYKEISNESSNKIYLKIHDALYKISKNKFNIPLENTARIIYLLRNPLDVVVSFANHSSISFEKSINFINNPNASLAQSKNKLDTQLKQSLFSWSAHVKSWEMNKITPTLIIRYEDILANEHKSFSEILSFLDIKIDEKKLNRAIMFSSFKELKKQENEKSFKEKPSKAESFFKNGKSNTWANVLNNEQIKSIIRSNYEIMKKYNYI